MAKPPPDPSELVTIAHADIEGTGQVPRSALDDHINLGWSEVSEPSDTPAEQASTTKKGK